MKNIICNLCNYSTNNKSHFNRHCMTNIGHNTKEERDKICILCNKNFDTIQSYKNHKYNLHKWKTMLKQRMKKQNIINNNKENTKIIIEEIKEAKKEIKDEQEGMKEEMKEIKNVVNNAITTASSLIKYLS
jgi:hypothetical protein